jgi:hypothetical protein
LKVTHERVIQEGLVKHREEVTTSFESLSTEVECYKCNKFGHMAKDCRMDSPS